MAGGAAHLDLDIGNAIADFVCASVPMSHMALCVPMSCVLTPDDSTRAPTGMIEYWSPQEGFAFPADAVSFTSKLDTDLYALAKAKVTPRSLDLSPDGSQFSVVASDWCVLV